MEPSTVAAPSNVDGKAKATDDKIALLSSLLHKLEEAAQNDGLAGPSTDSYQSQLVKTRLGMASSLFTALRAKNPATANHCFRVALGISSWSAARNLGDEYRDAVEVAALLHDLGKIGVPDSVLLKTGKLSADELLSLDRSRLIGYEILSGCCASTMVHEIMLYASAWYDGSKHGFDRIGDRLPLGARMLAVVDAFDSMTTDHVYRPAMSRERALLELCEFAGSQFDPNLVKEFTELITRDAGAFQTQVARRWLQDLSPEKSDAHWTLRQPLVTHEVDRRDEEFQERLVETMQDGVLFVDQEIRILRWNAAAERLTGIAATTVQGKQWSPTLVQLRDDRGRLLSDQECPVTMAIRTCTQTFRRYAMTNRNSERVSIELQISPVLGADGTAQGAALVIHDVSSQTSLEERVQCLHEKASRDPLTKAANRSEFNAVFPAFIETHAKAGRPCSVIMCDIDHFKRINDSYGHQAGDEALVQFTAVLQRYARIGDLVVRYGGEEFVLLCADCDNAAATRRAEEIRKRIAETPINSLHNRTITASFGVTEIQGGDSTDTFLNRADRALLQAKDSGRNAVIQLGTGICPADAANAPSWRNWFSGRSGEVLLDRTLMTMVPLKVAAEKLRGFVADHQAQLVKVDDDRVTLTIDSQFLPLVRRTNDRPVPFHIELLFQEKQMAIEGRTGKTALRTLIHVSIRPKRQRDRRQRDSLERSRQLLSSLKSYLMAHDYLTTEPAATTEPQNEGLLRSSQKLLSSWLGK